MENNIQLIEDAKYQYDEIKSLYERRDTLGETYYDEMAKQSSYKIPTDKLDHDMNERELNKFIEYFVDKKIEQLLDKSDMMSDDLDSSVDTFTVYERDFEDIEVSPYQSSPSEAITNWNLTDALIMDTFSEYIKPIEQDIGQSILKLTEDDLNDEQLRAHVVEFIERMRDEIVHPSRVSLNKAEERLKNASEKFKTFYDLFSGMDINKVYAEYCDRNNE